MPYYLHQFSYKDREIRDMVTKPHDRAEVVRVAIEAFRGKLHQFYFTLGEYDGLSISEFPDNETALACVMSIAGQGGLAILRTTALVTTQETERAMKKAHKLLAPPRK